MSDLKADLDKYIADKEALDSRYDSLRAKAIRYINKVIATFAIKSPELSFAGKKEVVKTRVSKAKKAKKAKRVVAKNYRAPDGTLWTGRGKAPKAFQVLFDQGHKKSEYFIGKK